MALTIPTGIGPVKRSAEIFVKLMGNLFIGILPHIDCLSPTMNCV
jgi:hypothetical protein